MVQKSKLFRGFLVALCVIALVATRFFEDKIFYDPFLNYFKSNFINKPFPDIDLSLYFMNVLFRYLINSTLTLAILALLFNDLKIVKFSSILLIILFVLLTLTLFLVLKLNENPHKMTIFYLRRFLIQPLFLLLFVPGFYFHKKTKIDS
jgi:exosortase F-associated protein